ncbi:hypothetical protein ACFU93_42165 [Streptomyces sp. NPDC057611]|uniref:hypothetical protein n=1 Tax=Streptomyces sp. NPDC057611 TaxID=3346182 RepID=UPI0036AE7048
MRTRPALAAVLALAAAVLPGGAAGCSGSTCTDTSLAAGPAKASGPSEPLTLKARLTADGKPVAGARVLFGVSLKGPGSYEGSSDHWATTSADGVAQVRLPGGVAALGLSGSRVTGYEVWFQPANPVTGVDYCWSSAKAPLTCGGEACPMRPAP